MSVANAPLTSRAVAFYRNSSVSPSPSVHLAPALPPSSRPVAVDLENPSPC